MSHYWTAEDDPALRKLQALDWVDDLVEFPPDVIEEACRMWRRANKHRPTPHEIRELAKAELAYRKTNVVPFLDVAYEELSRKCREQWLSCQARWLIRGFICRAECRTRIPGYFPRNIETSRFPPSIDEQKKIVAHQEHQNPAWPVRVAAAYRWAHDQGRAMPPGLAEDSQQVIDLVRDHEGSWAAQDQERAQMLARVTGTGRNPDGSPTPEAIEFVEFASRQIRANLKAFVERSTAPFKDDQA